MRPNEEVCRTTVTPQNMHLAETWTTRVNQEDHTRYERCEDIEAYHFSNGER